MLKQLEAEGQEATLETCWTKTKTYLVDHYFTGNLLYILGSAGYVFENMREGWFDVPPRVDDIFDLFLASLFVVDAILYVLLWRQDEARRRWTYAWWGEVLNVLPSLGYLAASALIYYEDAYPEDLVSTLLELI